MSWFVKASVRTFIALLLVFATVAIDPTWYWKLAVVIVATILLDIKSQYEV